MTPVEAGSIPLGGTQGVRDARRQTRAPRATQPTWRAYLALTKPRVIELLLVTTVPVMFLAADGFPPLGLTLVTLVGGTMAAAGANVLNQVYDRDIDAVMVRTRNRPLVSGKISVAAATTFGVGLSVASVALLGWLVNGLAAALAAMAIGFYLLVYTMLLKRRTPSNIVWGGAAGCFPVLIGWAAVTGSLSLTPLVLFGIVFLWTPPHYWPLALRFVSDYRAAGVPMLPAVADATRVADSILRYSVAMVVASLLLTPVAGMGWLYTGGAVVLGVVFLVEAAALRVRVRTPGMDPRAMRLFHLSISYLSLLFACVALDPIWS